MAINYRNTDLDLVAPCDLTAFAAALKRQGVFTLHVTRGENGLWYAAFTMIGQPFEEPEATITAMLDGLEPVVAETADVWPQCSTREFNIGYDCGKEPWAFNNGLTNQTLARMARLGTSLRITLYPESYPEP